MDENKQCQSGQGAVRAVFAAATIALCVWLAFQLRGLLINLLIALTLASAISPLAEWFEKRKVPRVGTIVGLYLIVAATYAAIAAFVAPTLWDQAKQLYHQIPNYVPRVMGWYDQLITLAGGSADALSVDIDDVRGILLRLVSRSFDTAAGLLGLVLNSILVLFLTAYFVVEADDIWPKVLRFVPPNQRDRFAGLIRPLAGRLGGYVRGQILVSLVVASFLSIGLTLIGVKYSLVLGLLAGLLNLMPFVGSMLTAAFAVLVAANQSLLLGMLTLGLFGLEQWLESNIIVPQLLGKQVELHPVLVLFAILIGATLMGVVGALVAVPAAAALFLIVEEFYVKPLNQEGG